MALFISLLFIGGKHPQAEMNDNVEWMWPVDGVVTDTYGTRSGRHHGIDIAGMYGSPVHSVDQGVVTKSYYSNSYGHVVFVKHPNELETVYAHLSNRKVEEGDRVARGGIVGEMGSTGRSSGVHLHFEIHKDSWTVNKENSMNPVAFFGDVKVGENVQAMVNKEDEQQVAGVMETLAPHVHTGIAHYLPMSDLEYLQLSKENVPVIHVVERGDNLWNISQKYEIAVDVLMDLNELTSDIIHPEQELIVEESESHK